MATDFDREALTGIAEFALVVAGTLRQRAQDYYAEHKGEEGGIEASMALARDADAFAMMAHNIEKIVN